MSLGGGIFAGQRVLAKSTIFLSISLRRQPMDRIRPGRVGENAAFGRFELACPATLRLQEPLDHIAVLAAQQHHGRGIVSLGVFVGLTSPQPLDLGIRMLDMPRAAHSCGTQATGGR